MLNDKTCMVKQWSFNKDHSSVFYGMGIYISSLYVQGRYSGRDRRQQWYIWHFIYQLLHHCVNASLLLYNCFEAINFTWLQSICNHIQGKVASIMHAFMHNACILHSLPLFYAYTYIIAIHTLASMLLAPRLLEAGSETSAIVVCATPLQAPRAFSQHN
jgi:hypothetical protein